MKNLYKTIFILVLALVKANLLHSQCDSIIDLKVYQENFQSIYFLNETEGIAAGNGMMKTKNGGSSWYQVAGVTFVAVTFPSTNIGYAASSNGAVIKSNDKGETWSNVTSVTTTGGITHLSFVSNEVGYALGGSYIHKTIDGGLTWQSTYLENEDEFRHLGMYFLNADTGFVTSTYFSGNGRITNHVLKTTNGGTTWNSFSIPSSSLMEAIYFIDKNKGFVAGAYGALLKTLDGGSTWQSVNSHTDHEILSIHFADSSVGYAGTFSGYILKTSDGGNTWNALWAPTGANTFSVFCVNPQLAYAAGSTILKIGCEFGNELRISGPETVTPGTYNYSIDSVSNATYTWSSSGGQMLSANKNKATFKFAASGTYTINCAISNGTSRSYRVSVNTNTTAVSKNSFSTDLDIYPNPCNGSFALNFSKAGNFDVRVFNHLGEQVKGYSLSNTENSLNLTNIPKGVYYLEISSGKEKTIEKLIID